MILAVDSSSPVGSAALVEAGRLLREETFAGGRARGGGAAEALAGFAAGGGQVTAVVVGLGPGSYSGIRAAVAVCWGFAAARSLPLHGVSSLPAIAPGEFIAAGDARQGQFYFARVKDGAFLERPVLVDAASLVRRCAAWPELRVFSPSDLSGVISRAEVGTPRAALLAGLVDPDPMPHPGLPAMPEPLYLKPPHITKPRAHH
jgi:tRNA threonylcarbamoyladenosine biosynthesis protein TsaB